jgi:hypothetical protein
MATGKEMCEYICEYKREKGEECNPTDIWNMSPTGELWPVVELYQEIQAIRKVEAMSIEEVKEYLKKHGVI